MAQMGEIQHRGDPQDVKGVMNYVYQLEEQIRYVLQNLGSDNLTPGSVDLAQLGPNVTKQFTTIINGQTDLETYTRKKVSSIQDEFGNYSTTMQTESFVGTYVSNALGDYSTSQETAEKISTFVTNALGDYSTTQQTSGMISNYVANNAYTQVSGITITPPGIELTGSQYVKIGTNGKLIITAGNFTISEQGTVNFKTGLIGGFDISEGYLGDPTGHVYMHKDVISGNHILNGGVFVFTNGSPSGKVFEANTAGQVYIGDNLISNGWIQNAYYYGNTLILTKHNGSTVQYTPTFTQQSPIYSAPQTIADGEPSYCTYNPATNRFTLYFGDNYITFQG